MHLICGIFQHISLGIDESRMGKFVGIPQIKITRGSFAKKKMFLYSSVDSRNFKKWGRSPTTTQNVGEGLKNLGDDFMIKFKLIKNTFSVYLDIFNSGLLLISGQFLLSCPIKINFKASDRILKKY